MTMMIRSPQSQAEDTLRNGEIRTPSPRPRIQARIHSTMSEHKHFRFNILIFVFRFATFCFSLCAAIFMFTNSRGSDLPRWKDFEAFRFVAIANAIIALYSMFEVGASVWEISRGNPLLPETFQVWFDFGHDQVFAYLLLSASSAGTELTKALRERQTCTESKTFCVQSDISIALGFAGFLFLGFSSLLSGFRVARFVITGSRF